MLQIRGISSRRLAGFTLGLVLAGAGAVIPFASRTAQAREYDVAQVTRGAIELRVDAKGVVQPKNTVRVVAPGSGTVSSMSAGAGTRVARGQVLARITPDAVPVTPRAKAAEAPRPDDRAAAAELEAARAALEPARSRRDAARREADKLAAIPDDVPRLQIEAARRAANAADAAFEAASARVREAEAALRAARAPRPKPAAPRSETRPRADLVVTAPIDGVVVSRSADVGEKIKGAPTLFTIGPPDSAVEISVAITKAEAASLEKGMPAVASESSAPDHAFEGRITKLAAQTAVASSAVLRLDPAEAATLRPGTTVDVSVSLERRENVLVAPVAALHFTPEPGAAAKDDTVWVRTADDALVERHVELGLNDGASVEIVAGLADGDLVVTGTTDDGDDSVAPAPAAILAANAAAAQADFAFARTPEVDALLRYYASEPGQRTVAEAVERSAGLRERAEQIFAEERVPTHLVWLAQVESRWRPAAVSPVGAAGVWQLMPATAERFGLRVDGDVDERYDFEKSTRAAAQYLRFLGDRYQENWELAIGAYNCGEGAMDNAIAEAGGSENFWTLSRAGILPDETANYVPAVLAATVVGAERG